MSTHTRIFQIALAASVGIATIASESCRAQSNADIKRIQALLDKIDLQKIDGPYSHKSPTDLIAVVGFVTEVKGLDAVFRDCSGNVKTVKRSDLKRIQRKCPPGSPVGPCIVNAGGKIVPIAGYANYAKMYFGTGKMEIDPADLPAEYKKQIKAAKPGDWVAISYPTNKDKLDLSFIDRSEGM